MAVQQLRVPDQHVQDVVQDVSGAGDAFREIVFGEQAQGLAVHLEEVHLELGQVEFPLAPPQEHTHVLPAPEPRICGQLGGELSFEVAHRVCRGVWVAPEQVLAPKER